MERGADGREYSDLEAGFRDRRVHRRRISSRKIRGRVPGRPGRWKQRFGVSRPAASPNSSIHPVDPFSYSMPQTERLYYNEPALLEFDAEVLGTLDLGDRVGVLLDRTAFYPTSGGQPHDVGTLGGVALVDCYEDEKSGDIIHVLAGK